MKLIILLLEYLAGNSALLSKPYRGKAACIAFLFLLVFKISGVSQPLPVNIGFETGTFSNWTGATGQCCPIYTPQPGIDTARHVITTGNFTDPYSTNLINVVAPGSLFSARLGNESGSAESEILDYTFNVPADSLLLVLRFAVILENANHPEVKQPRFGYEVTSNSPLIDGCLSEQVIAGDTAYDFIVNGPYELLNWQTRVINLTGMQGATVTIHFETGDCEPGGHFGYAYVDAELIEAEITGTVCNADGSITLHVTTGLNGIWFDGSNADSIHILTPLAGSIYSYEMGNENGCPVTLTKTITDEIPVSAFTYNTDCALEVNFQNNTVAYVPSAYTWDFGDGQTGNQVQPVHIYNGLGIYEVTLTVVQSNSCKSVTTELIALNLPPEADFTVEGVCVSQPFVFTAIETAGYSYTWFIDGQPSFSLPQTVHIFSQPGSHIVQLIVADAANCTDTLTSEISISDFDACLEVPAGPWIPNAFTPNGDGRNDFFEAVISQDSVMMILTIYDRFGEQVFSGPKWDGRYNGQLCAEGIYAYVLQERNALVPKKRKGTVRLIR